MLLFQVITKYKELAASARKNLCMFCTLFCLCFILLVLYLLYWVGPCNLALKKKGKSKKIDNLSSSYYTFSTAVSTVDLMFVKGKKSKQFVISEAAQTVLLDLVL